MKLTEQDKDRLRHLANVFNAAADGRKVQGSLYGTDWFPINPQDITRQIELHGHVRIAPSQPLPGPNPGGVTAEELGQEMQPTTPDPGPGYRLVDTKTEPPREDAEVWNSYTREWQYTTGQTGYLSGKFYRVPLTKRLVPPTGEELLGMKVRNHKNPFWAGIVTEYDHRGFNVGTCRDQDRFDCPVLMEHGQRTDPKTGEWIPWTKEVWE